MKHEFTKNYALIYASGLINSKDTRYFMKYIKVEDNTAYATDSKALIRFPLYVDDGYYEIVKKTKCQTHITKVKELSEADYPDCSGILDDRSDSSKMEDFRELNYYLDEYSLVLENVSKKYLESLYKANETLSDFE